MSSVDPVLCAIRTTCPDLPDAGVWPFEPRPELERLHAVPRAEAEHDERYLQWVVYLVLRRADGALWAYRRGTGDARLQGRCSIGVGGHVDAADAGPDLRATLQAAVRREIAEELSAADAAALLAQSLEPQAFVYEGLSAVGRVHLGVVFLAAWTESDPPSFREAGLHSLGFLPVASVSEDPRFELWSRQVAEWLRTK
ncbi:MAG: NUDIX domain-containing protein [Xanthomonadales bacterium]|nr:NUDIX domain-containing protein [Xanthomonadales bacterium]